MSNTIFIILIACCTAYLSFLTSKGGLVDNRFSKFWQRLTRKGKLFVFISTLLVVILVCQEFNTQFLLKDEYNKRDSIVTTRIKKGVDSSTTKLFDNLSKAFAKQNLKIDTLKNTVTKLKDSIKTTVNNYSQEDPVLTIDSKGISLRSKQNTKYDYEIVFISNDAGSTNYNVKTFVLIEYQDGLYSFMDENLLANIKFPKNGKWTTGFKIYSEIGVKNIYIYIKGKYSTLDGTKKYPIDDVYMYEEINKKTFTIQNPTRSTVISIIKKYTKK